MTQDELPVPSLPLSTVGAPEHLKPEIRKHQNACYSRRARERRKTNINKLLKKIDASRNRIDRLQLRVNQLVRALKQAHVPVPEQMMTRNDTTYYSTKLRSRLSNVNWSSSGDIRITACSTSAQIVTQTSFESAPHPVNLSIISPLRREELVHVEGDSLPVSLDPEVSEAEAAPKLLVKTMNKNNEGDLTSFPLRLSNIDYVSDWLYDEVSTF